MKKSLLALAVLGAFAGAASAQSSVTIYGSLDQAVSKGNGGTASNPGANGTSKAWQVRESNGSRLGFRGNEDLGGGLSAQFQIEHRFTPDTGALTNANVFWQGRSYVQLSSASAGRVYLGREYAPVFWPAVKSDPFGWDGVGQMGTFEWAGYLTTSGVRVNNTVGYRSPSWGGFTVNAAVGLGEAATSRANGFNAEYAAGPIYAAFGYEKLNKGPVTTDGNSVANFAFHYDLGMIKPIFYYARAKVTAGGVGGAATNKFWQLAALAPVGGGTIKAAYGRLDYDKVLFGGVDTKSSKLGLGYDYPLSKRTNLYADVGWAKQDNKSNNSAYAFGVKHTF
ncbi:MAG TPA: porin [Albitalea sp.]|nr:porin [Albitalea sp.]